jgi:hypothetical protein
VPPTPVRLTRRALEGGLAAPSNAFSVITQGHAVTSGRRDRSSPSLSTLCGHPRHCRTTARTVTTSRCCWSARGQDVAMTATVPRTGPPSMAPSNRPTTVSRQPTTTPPPLKPLLYEHRTRHDASTGAGFARTAVNSVALLAMLPHVRRVVRHACKLLPPWPIKGGAVPQPRGTWDDGQRSPTHSPPSPRYWHLPQSIPLGLGG